MATEVNAGEATKVRNRTAIVIGAGASAEFGLPIGSELQHEIGQLLDIRYSDDDRLISGDNQIVDLCWIHYPTTFNQIQKSAWLIRDGIALSDSIDNFMDKHASNDQVRWLGQLSIAKSIALAERTSKLYVSRQSSIDHFDLRSVEDTWLFRLFKILQRNVRRGSIENLFENVSFVVFNYDRCVEHFFRIAVSRSYGCSDKEASEIVSRADIVHPYGTIGALPWGPQGNRPVVDFGADRLPLLDMAKGIRTYTDQIEDGEFLASIKMRMRSVEQLVFLGFSYLPQNLELLSPKDGFNAQRAFGTAFGISNFNRIEIERDIKSRTLSARALETVSLVDEKCGQFISNFERAFV